MCYILKNTMIYEKQNYLYGLLQRGFIAGFTSRFPAEIRQCDKEFISSDDSRIVYMGEELAGYSSYCPFYLSGESVYWQNFEGTSYR